MPENQVEEWIQRILYDPLTGRIIAATIALLIIVALVRLLRRNLVRRIPELSARYRLRKFITVGGYILGGLALSIIFSDRLGRLTVFFGIFGAGVAFALQEVIAALAGWVAITFGRYYRFGDRVLIGGVMGDVIDIGLLRTTLMECGEWVHADLYTGRIVTVSNALVLRQVIYNYSADFPFLWDEISVPIRYGSDRDLARDILLRVAREEVGSYAESARSTWENVTRHYLIEPETVEPVVTLVATDNWMEYTLRYVVGYKRRRWTRTASSLASWKRSMAPTAALAWHLPRYSSSSPTPLACACATIAPPRAERLPRDLPGTGTRAAAQTGRRRRRSGTEDGAPSLRRQPPL